MKRTGMIVKRICWCVTIIESIYLLAGIDENSSSIWNATTDLNAYLLGFLGGAIAMILADIIFRVWLFPRKKYGSKCYIAINFLILGLWLFVVLFVIGEPEIKIPVLPVLFVTVGYLLVYYGIIYGKRYMKTGSLKKQNESYETSFKELVQEGISEDLTSEVAKSLCKRMNKQNKRRNKKGLSGFDREEFFEFMDRESLKSMRIMSLFYPILTLAVVIMVAIQNEVMSTVIFAVILVAIEYAVYRFFVMVNKKGIAQRKVLLKQLQEQKLSLQQFVNKLDVEE